jgi:hypothetical protein
MSPPAISVLIHTASEDDFLTQQDISSYFRALTDNLTQQTFKEFELVFVDTFYEENRQYFREIVAQQPFQIKHVPVHPEHRYWYDQGYCYISAAKNTGILHADGELCISFDDAEFFPVELLSTYWDSYKNRGLYLHALHKRMRSVGTVAGLVTLPIAGDHYINDHRWDLLSDGGVYVHRYGSLCFAGTSFSLEDALQLNGYNERMDGCKSLEDCDFGSRLSWLGRSFTLLRSAWLAIVDHPNCSAVPSIAWTDANSDGQQRQLGSRPARKKIDNLIAIENHRLLRCGIEIPDPRANCQPLTDAHWAIITRETLKYRGFDPQAPENAAALAIWLKTPCFNLRKQREDLRKTPNWKSS